MMEETAIHLPQGAARVAVTGPAERNLKLIREAIGVRLTERGGELRIAGEPHAVATARNVIDHLLRAGRKGQVMDRNDVLRLLAEISDQPRPLIPADSPNGPAGPKPSMHRTSNTADRLDVYRAGRVVRPKSEGQRAYLDAILSHDLTICTGPAGTGKTYLAVAAAVSLLKAGRARKLVLCRPAVEAGERLGFLPGTMQEKVNPYLRPLLDALHDTMDYDNTQRLMSADVIEIVPLAFMRGRTLNDAVILLDEAQNATKNQMLMFLTRLGQGSKMVVTGDTSQTDLPDARDSGLVDAVRRLSHVRGVARCALSKQDIVRHDLVQRIVDAYEMQGQSDVTT